MKKLLFSFFLTLSVSLSVVGQINLDGIIPETSLFKYGSNQYGSFERFKTSSGDKFVSVSLNRDSIKIFNSDWSFYKLIVLPSTFRFGYTNFISDKLFNSDSNIEFLCFQTGSTKSLCYLYNELGQNTFTFPDSTYQGQMELTTVNGVYKIYYDRSNFNTGDTKVFSLPGTLPCDQCGSLNGLVEPNTGGIGEMKVYPNPFNNTLQVNYDFPTNQNNPRLVLTDILGRELKEIKLTSQSDNVSINTSDLPKGTIIVSLFGGQNMISKKVIKID